MQTSWFIGALLSVCVKLQEYTQGELWIFFPWEINFLIISHQQNISLYINVVKDLIRQIDTRDKMKSCCGNHNLKEIFLLCTQNPSLCLLLEYCLHIISLFQKKSEFLIHKWKSHHDSDCTVHLRLMEIFFLPYEYFEPFSYPGISLV